MVVGLRKRSPLSNPILLLSQDPLTPLAPSFQAKPTFVNITDYTQPSKTAPVSTSSVPSSSATGSKEREQVSCAQNEGEEERQEGGGTARDSAVQGTSVLVTGSEPREAGPTSSERNGSGNLLGEGVETGKGACVVEEGEGGRGACVLVC